MFRISELKFLWILQASRYCSSESPTFCSQSGLESQTWICTGGSWLDEDDELFQLWFWDGSYVYIYTHVYNYIYIYIHVYTYIYIYISVYIYICIYIYIYVYIYICIYICNIYIYINKYIYIITYIYILHIKYVVHVSRFALGGRTWIPHILVIKH